jgi:phenylpyruvate tautomerase PptA (4-oxalocrotonate tautomerase family)
MPTYVCTIRKGQLSPDQKSRIAAEVTRIHSEVTGAPTFFAQVIFEEVKPGNHFMGGVLLAHDQLYNQIFVYGRVRAGRSVQDKLKMIKLMAEAVANAAGVSRTGVWIYIAKLPPRQMMEYGYVLPEPGDEEVWTNALPKEDREFMQSVGR